MNIQAIIDSRIAMASSVRYDTPEAVIVFGSIASGKTTLRKKKFSAGYVHIDSADIFHELSNGDSTLDFPDAFTTEIDQIGREITKQAFDRRLSVVLEIPGHEQDQIIALIHALQSVGYTAFVAALDTDRETCERQHATRGDNVSSYWAAPIHLEWVTSECRSRAAHKQTIQTEPASQARLFQALRYMVKRTSAACHLQLRLTEGTVVFLLAIAVFVLGAFFG